MCLCYSQIGRCAAYLLRNKLQHSKAVPKTALISCSRLLSSSSAFSSNAKSSSNDPPARNSKVPDLIKQEQQPMIAQIQVQIDKLLKLKAKLQNEPTPVSQKSTLKIPKGTRDCHPQQMALRQIVLDKIVDIFQKYGAETIDTPVFEINDVLTGKYGEDSKLIYDLNDHAGEKVSLRYDLTVPFARYLAMYKITNVKRYHIAKVYRRDDPKASRGRYREFYQCDFDISGTYDPMLPDAECVKIVSEILKALDIGEFVIKLNHRLLLDGIFETCGVPIDKFKIICSSVDKLDKFPWADVRKEMIEEKGLDEMAANKIGEYVQLNGSFELIEKLLQNEHLKTSPSAVESLKAMKLLFSYCKILGVEKQIIFDLSLARGLDYYTGIIFEAVLKNENSSIGSIAGGGRYDNLVGMFDAKDKYVPCVGVSIGVERIFDVLEAKNAAEGVKLRTNNADVYVVSAHKGLYENRLKIAADLWDAGIRTEHSYKLNPKILNQFQHCEHFQIPYAVIIGDSELERGVAILREVESRKEIDVPLDALALEIQKRLAKTKN